MSGCPQCDVEHPRGAPDCPAQRLGRTIGGRYRIERLLGIGGMGAVYEAVHLELGARVAVKTIRGRVAPSADSVERFEREARELAALRHPGIVEVRDLGRDEVGMPFMVMELLEGENLAELLGRGPIAVDHLVRLAVEALEALAEAHAHGIVHRDLKPANLFLARTRDGERIKILDFGVAKVMSSEASALTRTGLAIGSAPYMSPEQTQDAKRIDPRSDLYAMGATLFELLTSRLSAEGANTVEVVVRIAKGEIRRHPAVLRADVPEWLDSIVAKALATEPAERFQSALQMKRALQEGKGVATLPGAAIERTASPTAVTTPAALAVTAPATPPVPAGVAASRTPSPVVIPEASPRGAPAPADAARARRRGRILVAGIALAGTVVALVVVAPRWIERPDDAQRRSATDPREEPSPSPRLAPARPTPPARPAPAPSPTPPPAAPVLTPAEPASATAAHEPRGGDRPAPVRVTKRSRHPPPPAPAPAPAPATEQAPVATRSAPTLTTFDQGDEPLFPTRETGLPQMPSMQEVFQRLMELRPQVSRCAPGRTVSVRFQIAGASGRARAVQLLDFEGTPAEGACVAGVIRNASFPRFSILVFSTQYVFRP